MTKNTSNQKHPKKVLFIITKSNFGGAQRYVLDLSKSLKERDYNVKIAMGGSGVLFEKLKEADIKTIKIHGLNRDINIFNEIRAFINTFIIIFKERPDILHLNSSKSGLGALAARICMVPKIIFTLHGLATNENRNPLSKLIIKIAYWATVILSHKTIAVSDSVRKQLINSIPFVSKRIVVIHNGIDTPEFHSKHDSKNILKELIGHDKDLETASLFIGTIGELHPIKGHEYLIDGFKRVIKESPLPLYLFIIGDGQNMSKTVSYINKSGVSKNVFLCGHINDASKILKAFDVFILPSISEGLPYVVLESGAASLPIICSRVGGIPEIIKNGENGILINPKSSSEIADSVLSLIFDHETRRLLGSNLHDTIKHEFTISKMVGETEKIYLS